MKPVTMINRLAIKPGVIDEFIEAQLNYASTLMEKPTGLIGSRLYRGLDGRTVVLDWEQPGRGAPLSDLAWYLAINCRRLPQSKEASIAAYREELEGCGIDTGPWWDRQLALCLLGAMVLFGWEKALGGYDEELAWWETKSLAAAALLS